MRRVNLIPMAGAGQRFVDAGYDLPKPLIPVNGKPMVLRAADSLPAADQWIFVCQQEHLDDSEIAVVLEEHFPGCEIIPVSELTEGQACTCLLAESSLRSDDVLTIGACDNGMSYERAAWETMMFEGESDAMVWSFTGNEAVVEKPEAYGWVRFEEESRLVSGVSCKKPVSENPINDYALVGAFSYRRAATFVESVNDMIEADVRVNGEFYMDVAFDLLAKSGKKVSNFAIDSYHCWGTPQDLERFLGN